MDRKELIEEEIIKRELNYSGSPLTSEELLRDLGAVGQIKLRYMILAGKIFKKRGWVQIKISDEKKQRKVAWEFITKREDLWK